MNYQVVLTREADVDTVDILYWLSEEYSLESAARWYSKLQDAVASLQGFPARCPVAHEGELSDGKIVKFNQHTDTFVIVRDLGL